MAAEAAPAILIANGVLQVIQADAARFAGKKERGGILLGFRRGPHLEIDEATLPTAEDRGTMFSFRRSVCGHQAAAVRRWKASKGTADWVGEWHSHSEAFPSPSSIDVRSWTGMVERRGAAMVFVIVGYEALWVGLVSAGRPDPVRYVEVEETSFGKAFIASRRET